MENFYQSMLTDIRKYPTIEKTIIALTKYIPIIIFIIYPCLILYLFITRNNLLIVTILKPLSAFVLVTIIRKIINRKRPYATMEIKPLVTKDKQGESFPSRHTVSACAIALASLHVSFPLGILMMILALIVSTCRILCGVHYISDVLSAIILALIIDFI